MDNPHAGFVADRTAGREIPYALGAPAQLVRAVSARNRAGCLRSLTERRQPSAALLPRAAVVFRCAALISFDHAVRVGVGRAERRTGVRGEFHQRHRTIGIGIDLPEQLGRALKLWVRPSLVARVWRNPLDRRASAVVVIRVDLRELAALLLLRACTFRYAGRLRREGCGAQQGWHKSN